MSPTGELIEREIGELRERLATQGKAVRRLADAAFDAFFTASDGRAREAIAEDDAIDEADVAIEQTAVALLTRVAREATPINDQPIRSILTLVKINNEYERIADAGVTVAERAIALSGNPAKFPATTRVMTNSVLGILRDTTKAYDARDATLARLVLQSEHMVTEFKNEILRSAERGVAAGEITVDLAFDLHELACQCQLMADHAVNVAEQVIYENTGVIVRHREGAWIEAVARRDD